MFISQLGEKDLFWGDLQSKQICHPCKWAAIN